MRLYTAGEATHLLAALVLVGAAAAVMSWSTLASTESRLTSSPPPAAGASYGWPIRPFLAPHPVRGAFGDPREITPSLHVLHFGVDIAAPDGTPVYAVAAGTAHSQGARSIAIGVAGGRRAFGYWHIVPAVADGQAVALHQLVGHVARPWGHLHFAESDGTGHLNPLRPGGIGPYADRTVPRVTMIAFVRDGRPIGIVVTGTVDIVASADDRPALPAPRPWDGARLTPALVRWRVLGRDTRALARWHTAYDVRTRLPTAPFERVYAPGTRQNRSGRAGLYRFYLLRGWRSGSLANGTYALEVSVSDTRGNASTRTLRFTAGGGD